MEGVEVYVEDIVIFSDTWEEHLRRLEQVLFLLKEANLTVNLSKSDFVKAKVIYLVGHVVGQGLVKPIKANVKSIIDYPIPENKKGLMRFLGIEGYYRKFCKKFSEVTAPLTELLKKSVKYHCSETCQKSFHKVKNLLCLEPVLTATDTGDVGAGALLLQSDDKDIEHPVCYFSKKFNVHQKNYSTVEKECLALIFAIQHFDIYISSSSKPTIVYTDHNPLVFLHKMKNKC